MPKRRKTRKSRKVIKSRKVRKTRKSRKVRKSRNYFGGYTSAKTPSSLLPTPQHPAQPASAFLAELDEKTCRQVVKDYLNKNINLIAQAKRDGDWDKEATDHENIVDKINEDETVTCHRNDIDKAVGYWLECNDEKLIKKKSCQNGFGCINNPKKQWESHADESEFSYVGCPPLVRDNKSPPALGASENLDCTCRHKHRH